MGDNVQNRPVQSEDPDDIRRERDKLKGDLTRVTEKLQTTNSALLITREKMSLIVAENDMLHSPVNNYAFFDSVADADKRYVNILRANQKMRVGVSLEVDLDSLRGGQTLLLSESNAVIEALPFDGRGEILSVKEVYGDGKRVIVLTHNDDERMVNLTDDLIGVIIRPGDSLLVNKADFAIEVVEKKEVTSLMLEKVPNITYKDVGGLAEQIEQIHDAVELPRLYADLFAEYELPAPKGVLLYGPPGCGKTLIAKAIANSLATRMTEATGQEVNSFFINVKGPELLNKYVGETERHIRLIFERAREKASTGSPVVIFFDEMESMFRTRGSGISSDTESTIVPQLLTELDGVESLENVLVIGASNRQDMIDPAILRSGRFDIKIRVDRPDRAAAVDIFAKYLTPNLPLHKLELDTNHGDKRACVERMIEQTVDHMYAETTETQFLHVWYENHDDEVLYYKDFSSGAVIKSVVDRAKKAAIKDKIETGQSGVQLQHLLDACNAEYKSNEDLPNNTNPDDWAKIAHRKGSRVVRVDNLTHIQQTAKSSIKPIENVNVPGTGQYL
ncbi:MAG TPA: proteasome ATPase [Candidatus Saccharimonadales bacterium]